jgi:hypothetical protein
MSRGFVVTFDKPGMESLIAEAKLGHVKFWGLISYGDQLKERWPDEPFCYVWHPERVHFHPCQESEMK